MLPLLGIVALAVLVPVLLGGARFYAGISEAAFRQIVLGLLTLSGVALLGVLGAALHCWRGGRSIEVSRGRSR